MENQNKVVYFNKGMTVYDVIFGEGVVDNYPSEDFTISVKFNTSGEVWLYTFDGRIAKHKPIRLSQKPIPPIINEPFDTRIELPKDVVRYIKQHKAYSNAFYDLLKQKYKI